MSAAAWARRRFAPARPAGRRAAAPKAPTRLGVETLDDRLVPAVTAGLNPGGDLHVVGDAGNNVVRAEPAGSQVRIVEQVGGQTRLVGTFAGAQHVRFTGHAGNDTFTNATTVPGWLNGGAGTDTLTGSRTAGDTFWDREPGETFAGNGGLDIFKDTATGVVTATGGAGADYLNVRMTGGTLVLNEYVTRPAGDYSLDRAYLTGVTRIDFAGGAGDDMCSVAEGVAVPTRQDGGAGHDELFGGSGNDVFLGSPGEDDYVGGRGADVLFRNGHRAYMHGSSTGNGYWSDTGDVTVGLVGGRLTHAELSAKGDLIVSLNGRKLTLNGPGGAGFELEGDWKHAVAGGQNVYTATGQVKLKSALGDIPIPSPGGALRVTAALSASPGVGRYTGTTWAFLPIDTTAGGSMSALGALSDLGFKVNPTGFTMTIGLGDALKKQGIDAPMNAGVPYIAFSVSSLAEFGFGGASVSPAGEGATVQGVFDPSDPFLFLRANIDHPSMPVDKLAVGVSPNGYIPFVPRAQPAGDPKPMYGHVYANMRVQLGQKPVKLEGEAVLDFDHNDDGVLGGKAFRVSDLVTGRADLGAAAKSVLGDLAVGVNGAGNVGWDLKNKAGQKLAKLSFDVAEGTAIFTPDYVGFRARTADIFHGTPLEGKVKLAGADVQAHVDLRDNSWGFEARADALRLGDYNLGGASLKASSATQRIEANANLNAPFGLGSADLTGWIGFNGNFSLSATAKVNLDAGIGTLKVSTAFTLSHTFGVVKLHADLSASISTAVYGLAGEWIATLSAGLSASFDLTVGNGEFDVSAKGKVWGKVETNVGDFGLDLGFGLDKDGFEIDLPVIPNIRVDW